MAGSLDGALQSLEAPDHAEVAVHHDAHGAEVAEDHAVHDVGHVVGAGVGPVDGTPCPPRLVRVGGPPRQWGNRDD